MPYTPEDIEQVATSMDDWLDREDELVDELLLFPYTNAVAKEFTQHGLIRRLRLIKHCVARVFETIPMDATDPDGDQLLDTTAYLHTFVINVFGAIDNMAHVWCKEASLVDAKGNPLRPGQIGFTPKCTLVRNSLSAEFQDYLATTDDWFAYLENYRHALAHRIPLYIPPNVLEPAAQAEHQRIQEEMDASLSVDRERYFELFAQQRRVGRFEPWMQHSYGEGTMPMRFHPQIVCDFSTVVEMGEHLLSELRQLPR